MILNTNLYFPKNVLVWVQRSELNMLTLLSKLFFSNQAGFPSYLESCFFLSQEAGYSTSLEESLMVNTVRAHFENVKLIVNRSFKGSKLFKNIFKRCRKKFMCIFIHKYSLVKVYQIIIFRILYLRKRGSLWNVAFKLSINHIARFCKMWICFISEHLLHPQAEIPYSINDQNEIKSCKWLV